MMFLDARCTNHQAHSTKVSRPPRGDGRTSASTVGGGGGTRAGLGGHHYGSACHWFVPHHDHHWPAGVGFARSTASSRSCPSAATGRRTEALDRNGPRSDGCLGSSDRTRNSRRPGIPVALDLQEYTPFGGRVDSRPSSGQRQHRGSAAASGGLQPTGQSQDEGRSRASRPQHPVRAHQHFGAIFPRS